MPQLPLNILNRLLYGKTDDGKVAAEIKPTGSNPNNKAWLCVIPQRTFNFENKSSEITTKSFIVEYLELREDYSPEKDGYDWDLFLVKKEEHYIKNQEDLVKLLTKWLDNFSVLKHPGNTTYPK